MNNAFIGAIVIFAGNFAPKNWALCNGQILSIATNQALFSILGTTYGGDGRTTFALPNLQGRVALHAGQSQGTGNYSLGQIGGNESVSLTTAQMPSHTHAATVAIKASGIRPDSDSPVNAVLTGEASGPEVYGAAVDPLVPMNSGMATTTMGNAGASQGVAVVQPYQCVNYIICLYGIFPSRN